MRRVLLLGSLVALALAVVRFRRCNANLSRSEIFLEASRNEALTADEREMLKLFAHAGI